MNKNSILALFFIVYSEFLTSVKPYDIIKITLGIICENCPKQINLNL